MGTVCKVVTGEVGDGRKVLGARKEMGWALGLKRPEDKRVLAQRLQQKPVPRTPTSAFPVRPPGSRIPEQPTGHGLSVSSSGKTPTRDKSHLNSVTVSTEQVAPELG